MCHFDSHQQDMSWVDTELVLPLALISCPDPGGGGVFDRTNYAWFIHRVLSSIVCARIVEDRTFLQLYVSSGSVIPGRMRTLKTLLSLLYRLRSLWMMASL